MLFSSQPEISEPVFPFYMHTPEIISGLPTRDSVIALTFDACESVTPSYFDTALLDYIIRNELPATFFISGKFAARNSSEVKKVSEYPFTQIENHSYDHVLHMERMPLPSVFSDVDRTDDTLYSITGTKTRFFRFPGGHYDLKSLLAVNQMMYRVVHWTYPSGDADSTISEKKIIDWNVSQAIPGAILIFHINGRGYRTKHTLPVIVRELKKTRLQVCDFKRLSVTWISILTHNRIRFMTLTDWFIATWFLTCLTELLVGLIFFPYSARLLMTIVILNTATQPSVFNASLEIYETFLFRPFALWGLWLAAEFSAAVVEVVGWKFFFGCPFKKCAAVSFATNTCTALMSFLL